MSRPDWTKLTLAERKEKVLPLVREGHSATEIALVFDNASRNAIVGFRHRHAKDIDRADKTREKPTKPKTSRRRETAKPKRATSPVAPTPIPAPEPQPEHAVPFLQANGSCKWPLWDRPSVNLDDMKVCGGARHDAGPYCAHHAERARRPGPDRAESQA